LKLRVLTLLCAAIIAAAPILGVAHEQTGESTFWFGHPGEAGDVTRTIQLSATDLKFTPVQITVAIGETVKFEIGNDGQLQHEFILGSAAEQVEHDKEMAATAGTKMTHLNVVSVAPGKTGTLIWTFAKAGTLQYACHVRGHYVAGMVGQLTIK
jgi:uncharacterized cupredoxin-like copper-binding protein